MIFHYQKHTVLNYSRINLILTRLNLILTLLNLILTRLNHSAKSHPRSAKSHSHSTKSHPHSSKSHPHVVKSHPKYLLNNIGTQNDSADGPVLLGVGVNDEGSAAIRMNQPFRVTRTVPVGLSGQDMLQLTTLRPNSWTKSRQKSTEFVFFLFTVTLQL